MSPKRVAIAVPDDHPIVLMRNSERSTFRRCRQKWEWSYNLRLEPERTKGALTFGRLVHSALEGWYVPGRKRGIHPATTFEQLYLADAQQFSQWDEDGERYDALELGLAMLNGYVDEYGQDDHIEIIQSELPLEVDVYDKHGNYLCTWIGKSDAAYKDLMKSRKGKPYIGALEHKTAKSIPDDLRVNTGYGEQGLSYWWAMSIVFKERGILPEGVELQGVQFNWLRKGMPDERPRNEVGHRLNKPGKAALQDACAEAGVDTKGTMEVLTHRLLGAGWTEHDVALLGEVSKNQPRPLFYRWPLEFSERQLDTINRRIRMEAYEMALVRAGKLPIYKNPTKDCDWDCPFKEACEIHEMGGDFETVLELEFMEWDPYDYVELEEEKT